MYKSMTHMYIYIYMYIYICMYVSLSLSISLSLSLSLYIYIYIDSYDLDQGLGQKMTDLGRHMGRTTLIFLGFPSGIIRERWNDTKKISMAPAQG